MCFFNHCCCSVAKLCLTLCDLHGLQHIRLPCPLLSPRVCSNSYPLSQWWHPTISSSVTLSPPALNLSQHQDLFQWVFPSGGQSIGASTSAPVLPMNMQCWFSLGLTGLISLLCKGLSKVFSSTTIWKHQFFRSQPSLIVNDVVQLLFYLFFSALLRYNWHICLIGEANGTPLQYSCLENPMDGGPW